jgi:copper(I)-binding protein
LLPSALLPLPKSQLIDSASVAQEVKLTVSPTAIVVLSTVKQAVGCFLHETIIKDGIIKMKPMIFFIKVEIYSQR